MSICALGDSIFAGYLVGGKSLINNLNENGFDIDNYGINGLTSEELLFALDNLIPYDKYIIHIGLNDFLNGKSVETVFKNIERIVKKLKNLGGEIYVISPYLLSSENVDDALNYFMSFKSINLKIKEFNEVLKENAHNNFKIISFYDYSVENNIGHDLIDGIHPNIKLHIELSKIVEEVLNGHI